MGNNSAVLTLGEYATYCVLLLQLQVTSVAGALGVACCQTFLAPLHDGDCSTQRQCSISGLRLNAANPTGRVLQIGIAAIGVGA
jgi:hypothetical protein